ncbi:MAG: RNA 2',3'-cyclic phosphodiesterase, partial [Candidatus Cloacimonadaceae bacterium]|nr:RNA 2',3'-cyclic phosphodiesterase [Candidatus Cloacimonadaceae bacterium]
FIALEIPDEPKQQLCDYLLQWSRAYPHGINWVKPENLHVTLLFIGDVQNNVIPQLCKTLQKMCESLVPPAISMAGFEIFPSTNPRILWAKLASQDRDIFSLPKLIGKHLLDIGIETETRPLKLHATLGRIKSPQPDWRIHEFLQANLNTESYHYDTITLYKSTLKPDGPVYTILEQYVL